jgi:hypothetical protein
MRSRRRLLTLSLFLVAALTAGIAEAQPKGGIPQGGQRSNNQFALRREEAGGADAASARQRARAGDCAGALPAFDAAIRVTIEPTLRRDRGLCHEKLNDPFPAIDDYRAYLVARADAPDADQIRDRLSRLEEQAGVGGPSAQAVKERDDPNGFKARGQFSLGTEAGGSSSSSSSKSDGPIGPKSGEAERSYDYYATQERLADSADKSPLRYGTGWMLGPYVTIPRYFVGDKASKDLGYSVGAAVRYSFGGSASFISEFGFSGIGNVGENTSASGPMAFLGFELRVALDQWSSNQLLLGVGLGFERFTTSTSEHGLNSWEGRGRFGFRHVFGPSVGLEVTLDGGPAYVQPTGSNSPDGKVFGLVGGSYALIIGF